MAVKNRHTAKNFSFNLEKHLSVCVHEKLAVFGNLAAILKIKQKFLFGIINNIHLSLTMQKEILESLL